MTTGASPNKLVPHYGWLLWARFQSLPIAVTAAVCTALIAKAVLTVISRPGATIEDGHLFIAIAASTCLTIAMKSESSMERTRARSLIARRSILLLVFAAVIAAISVMCFGFNIAPYAGLACARDCVFLLGCACIVSRILPSLYLWTVPLLMGCIFLFFSPSYPLPTTETLWLPLKSPGLLFTQDGAFDGSWFIAAGAAALGMPSFLLR